MKKSILILLILTSLSSFSQFRVTGYFDAQIGVNYTFSDKIQTELRINDNLDIEFNIQLSLFYKFVSKEDYNVNIGVGISTFLFHSNDVKFLESLYLPLQIEITPFEKVRNFGLVLETAYHSSDIKNASGIRNSIGIIVKFHKVVPITTCLSYFQI